MTDLTFTTDRNAFLTWFTNSPVWDCFSHVAGIDPGLSTPTGVVKLDSDGIVSATVFRQKHGATLEERVSRLADNVAVEACHGILSVPPPLPLACVENNHVTGGRSALSALTQRELIGCIGAKLWVQGALQIIRTTPSAGKKILAGNGRAEKADMVEAYLDFPACGNTPMKKKELEAVADALAAALVGMKKWEAER